MLDDLDEIGRDWVIEQASEMVDCIEHMTPEEFNETYRYLPSSVSDVPGPFSFKLTPYMRELVNNADQRVPVQETNLLKGVQVGYTTMLECVLLYYIVFIKTRPCMMISADKELVAGRIENCILPMLEQSGFADVIQSSDEGNSRKTGKTSSHLQWVGGGFLIPYGANRADKMRMWSILLMLKDELDAWAVTVGKDGDPDKLTDARCDTFQHTKKIYRGGTPLRWDTSKIYPRYLEGDQRHYFVPCKHCGHMQYLKWRRKNRETGEITGFLWDFDDNGFLKPSTVRYVCESCGEAHYEHDKPFMFATENGAEWRPTAQPKKPGVRSYILPAFYSPYGFRPWSQCVEEYLEAYDPVEDQVKDIGKYQVFYNNVLAMPFKTFGNTIKPEQVSAHRRMEYRKGQIPNHFAIENCGGAVLFTVCTIDVHKSNLAVAVFGVTNHGRMFLIDYERYEPEKGVGQQDCRELDNVVWQRVEELITTKIYEADDGQKYRITTTFVDAGDGTANADVVDFCGRFASSVYPILGRKRATRSNTIMEFAEWETRAGTKGYRITVDHYKDRMALVLKREWSGVGVIQPRHHFNAPSNITDKELAELVAEFREKKVDPQGKVYYEWHRKGANELWDLLGYAYACSEIIAYDICRQHFNLDTVDWAQFWEFASASDNAALFGRVA